MDFRSWREAYEGSLGNFLMVFRVADTLWFDIRPALTPDSRALTSGAGASNWRSPAHPNRSLRRMSRNSRRPRWPLCDQDQQDPHA